MEKLNCNCLLLSLLWTKTICYSGILISQEVTWVSEDVQVISHHGGSFSLSTDPETHLSLISVCLGKTLKAPPGTERLSALFLGWKGKTSHPVSILESSANAPPFISRLWSAHFLSTAGWIGREIYRRQCKKCWLMVPFVQVTKTDSKHLHLLCQCPDIFTED